MGSFEKKIEKIILVQTIKAIVTAAFVVIVFILKVRLQGSFESVSEVDRTFLIGLFFGGEVSSIRSILKYRKALKTPEALEDLHINEIDERNRIIKMKTSMSTLKLAFTLLAIATVITSFFSVTVLYTLGLTFIVLLGLYIVLAFYYSRKF